MSIFERTSIHKRKIGYAVACVAIGWLTCRCFFPFGISQGAQEAVINEIFATAEITHIRIAYACCGNETPIETEEFPFHKFRAEDQERIHRLLRRIRWKSQYEWIPQRMPGIQLRVTSAGGSAHMQIRQALSALQIKRLFTFPENYLISGEFYEFQTAVCDAVRNSAITTEQIMSPQAFEEGKKAFEELCGRDCVESTFFIRLPEAESSSPHSEETESQ